MTLPASGPISIQDIKNEFAPIDQGWNDLNSWGQVVLERPGGQAVSLSEFYGRSYVVPELKYGPYNQPGQPPGYDSGPTLLNTAHGGCFVRWTGDEIYSYYFFDLAGNGSNVWPKFKGVDTHAGRIVPSQFAFTSGTRLYAMANGSGAGFNIYWVFHP